MQLKGKGTSEAWSYLLLHTMLGLWSPGSGVIVSRVCCCCELLVPGSHLAGGAAEAAVFLCASTAKRTPSRLVAKLPCAGCGLVPGGGFWILRKQQTMRVLQTLAVRKVRLEALPGL